MDLEQLTGRHRRLTEELAAARDELPSPSGRIDRLIQELSATELAIAAWSPVPTAPLAAASRTAAPTPQVARNRLTPFGQRFAEPTAE